MTKIVDRIIDEELNMRNVYAKFVPRMLNDEQKERHVVDIKGDGYQNTPSNSLQSRLFASSELQSAYIKR